MINDVKEFRVLHPSHWWTKLVLHVPEYLLISIKVNYSSVIGVKNLLKNSKPWFLTKITVIVPAAQLLGATDFRACTKTL